MDVALSPDERQMLDGERGDGVAMAMRIVVGLARAMRADRLLPITGAHIDSCLYHGQSGLDFVNALVDGGASVVVPTTLNVSSLDLLHPDLYQGDRDNGQAAKQLMDGYVELGCEPTWTCAPYQREIRPALGEHVAWAESNAIVFANSVLGARTHRYGDFIDIAAAITGRVPDAGLHHDRERRATVVIDVGQLSSDLLATDAAFPSIGFVVGQRSGTSVPAIVGLPESTSEDQLKALGAAAASSGSLAMFHAVGITPEAASLDVACGGTPPSPALKITAEDLRRANAALSTVSEGRLATISLGTPHYSVAEIETLYTTLAGRSIDPTIAFYVSTGREVLHECMLRGWVRPLEEAGVSFVTDTCTYITPIVRDTTGVAMTDSAKWAYYAPGNIGVDVIYASLAECVDSGVAGEIVRDKSLWR